MLQTGHLLLDAARAYPDRLAIINKQKELTYSELNHHANCIANGLKAHGADKGDRIAVLLRNSTEWVVAWYACLKIGAVCVPLHVRYRPEELIKMVDVAECTVLIYGEPYAETAEAIIDNCASLHFNICAGGEGREDTIPWDELIEADDHEEAQTATDNDDPCLLMFTSGTTGEPKGVLRTQEMMMLHAICMGLRNNNPAGNDVMMSTAPLYHIGGLQGLVKMHLIGGTYITVNGIRTEEIAEKIEKYKVTQFQILPPVAYERVYAAGDWRKHDMSSVWEVCISAGKCTMEYIEHIAEMFPNAHLRPSWGSTEAASITCAQISVDELRKDPSLIASVGSIMPMTEIRIVNDEGVDVAPGEEGEAWVRSPMVLQGYLNVRRRMAKAVNNDGWFRTGDIIRRDPESGLYYFADRKKDVIKTGGENVFALEVERVIQKYPGVLECAVVGITDERFGEAIGAAIVAEEGAVIEEESLLDYCRENLPSFKKPRYMAFMDALPTNPLGKVQKHILRDRSDELFHKVI